MDNIEKLWYACDNSLHVRITFVDGVVGDGLIITEATTNDFLIEPTDRYLHDCEKVGHQIPCVGQYEDVVNVEFVEQAKRSLLRRKEARHEST